MGDLFVVVSKAEDNDLGTELVVEVENGTAGQNFEVELKLEAMPSGSKGDAKFRKGTDTAKAAPAKFDIQLDSDGKGKLTLNVFGTNPGGAKKSTKITAQGGGKDAKVENVSIFKGVKCELEGVFSCPVQSVVPEGWRPGATLDHADVVADDFQTHYDLLATFDGDQQIPYRNWVTNKPNTTIKKSFSKEPVFELEAADDGFIKGSRFKTVVGALAGQSMHENIIQPEWMISDLLTLKFNWTGAGPQIQSTAHHPDPPAVTADVEAAANGNAKGKHLAKWLLTDKNLYNTAIPNSSALPPTDPKYNRRKNSNQGRTEPDFMAKLRFSWESPKLKATKGANLINFKKSPASKALFSAWEASTQAVDADAVEVRLLLGHYNIWTLTGKILGSETGEPNGSHIQTK